MKPAGLTPVERDGQRVAVALLALGTGAAATPFRLARILGAEWSLERALEACRCLKEHALAERWARTERYRLTPLGASRAKDWTRQQRSNDRAQAR